MLDKRTIANKALLRELEDLRGNTGNADERVRVAEDRARDLAGRLAEAKRLRKTATQQKDQVQASLSRRLAPPPTPTLVQTLSHVRCGAPPPCFRAAAQCLNTSPDDTPPRVPCSCKWRAWMPAIRSWRTRSAAS